MRVLLTDRTESLTLLFLMFLVWNLLDMALTIIGVTSATAHESNPVLAGMPFGYAMLFKMSMALLIGAWWLGKDKLGRLVTGNILLYGVCIWNILVLQGVV